MSMKQQLTAVLLASAIVCSAAQATVTYTFEGSYETDSGIFSANFVLGVPDYIITDGPQFPTTCSTDEPGRECQAAMGFLLDGFGTGKALVELSLQDIGGASGFGTRFYFFDAGAFASDGLKVGLTTALDDGTGSFYGSAGESTLLVESDDVDPPGVPEPASLMLLGAGFVGFGLARRRVGKG